MHRRAIVVTASIVGARIERLLDSAGARGRPAVVSYRALVCRVREVRGQMWTAIVDIGRQPDVDAMAREQAFLDLSQSGRR